eukprot:TRINITY_DN9380_c0_g1_i1.p1 TRINITY_DN9380_c0_g1~~TRINITY_DN9380_c0_g1_i1.p1  ORF type:complete len:315 (+),score=70.66 TRINITY_DN9380_c0_g1_i1:70-1014(+)
MKSSRSRCRSTTHPKEPKGKPGSVSTPSAPPTASPVASPSSATTTATASPATTPHFSVLPTIFSSPQMHFLDSPLSSPNQDTARPSKSSPEGLVVKLSSPKQIFFQTADMEFSLIHREAEESDEEQFVVRSKSEPKKSYIKHQRAKEKGPLPSENNENLSPSKAQTPSALPGPPQADKSPISSNLNSPLQSPGLRHTGNASQTSGKHPLGPSDQQNRLGGIQSSWKAVQMNISKEFNSLGSFYASELEKLKLEQVSLTKKMALLEEKLKIQEMENVNLVKKKADKEKILEYQTREVEKMERQIEAVLSDNAKVQ